MPRRSLQLESLDAVRRELDRLASAPYERNGNWSLGQICDHLSYYLRGSLEGFGFRLPWIVRVLVGKPIKRAYLEGGKEPPAGGRTVPKSVPAADVDDGEAVARFRVLLDRFEAGAEPLHASPLFGELTREEWERLHLRHISHHLGFLTPGV